MKFIEKALLGARAVCRRYASAHLDGARQGVRTIKALISWRLVWVSLCLTIIVVLLERS